MCRYLRNLHLKQKDKVTKNSYKHLYKQRQLKSFSDPSGAEVLLSRLVARCLVAAPSKISEYQSQTIERRDMP